MTYVFDEIFENVLAIALSIGAFTYLMLINPYFLQSNESQPNNTTVFTEMHQPIKEVTWTGSQVQYTLWEIEELGIPIRVGNMLFVSEKDVKESIHSIFPNQTYLLQTILSEDGELLEMQFSSR